MVEYSWGKRNINQIKVGQFRAQRQLVRINGYPLFHPQLFNDLPLEYRGVGTDIGDMGIIISDGSCDVIFNIRRAADDPINRFGIPDGFEQIYLGPGDVAPRAIPEFNTTAQDLTY
jgi:hypothetical protein